MSISESLEPLAMLLLYLQRGIKAADDINAANDLTLNLGDYPVGLNVISRVVTNGRENQRDGSIEGLSPI